MPKKHLQQSPYFGNSEAATWKCSIKRLSEIYSESYLKKTEPESLSLSLKVADFKFQTLSKF